MEGDITATFTVNYETTEGQNIIITGTFCEWALDDTAIICTWTAGHNWVGTLTMPAYSEISFKAVMISSEETKWEEGDDHYYKFGTYSDNFVFSWQA